MSETQERKSLIQYSMEGGLWLGLYFVLRFFSGVMGVYSPIFDALAMVLFVGTPFVLYRIMLAYHRNNDCITSFSLLWMMGIMLFLFASLITAIPEYIFYQYISPDYVANAMKQSVKLIEEWGIMQENSALEELRSVAESGAVPSALQMILSSMWSNLFFGSILSIIVSPFVLRNKKSNNIKN